MRLFRRDMSGSRVFALIDMINDEIDTSPMALFSI